MKEGVWVILEFPPEPYTADYWFGVACTIIIITACLVLILDLLRSGAK